MEKAYLYFSGCVVAIAATACCNFPQPTNVNAAEQSSGLGLLQRLNVAEVAQAEVEQRIGIECSPNPPGISPTATKGEQLTAKEWDAREKRLKEERTAYLLGLKNGKKRKAEDSQPARLAAIFDWDCPESAPEHTQHIIAIQTDAKHVLPKVRAIKTTEYARPVVFGPKVSAEEDGIRILEYSWTSFPGDYEVEVVTYDPEKGLTEHIQLVKIIPKTPPKPDPPTNPDPPTSGFGLASKVPGWVATVPEAKRDNAVAIKAALMGVYASQDAYETLQEIETATGAILGVVVQDKQAWDKFGEAFNNATQSLKSSGKISTADDYAEAIKEIAGAM